MRIWDRGRRKWREGEFWGAAVGYGRRSFKRTAKRIRTANSLYWVDPRRVMTKRYLERFSTVGAVHRLYGNYYLDSRVPLDEHSVVYSFGVGGDVDFDHAVAREHNCTVHLYDPTPSSIVFIEQLKEKSDPVIQRLVFHPFGVWCADSILQFHIPADGSSASAVAADPRGTTFEASCLAPRTMMEQNGHVRIDVLKMDIEGAADVVMKHLIEEGIFPRQVVAEFERPDCALSALPGWFEVVDGICQRMCAEGYEITLLPRERARYYGLELLFARP